MPQPLSSARAGFDRAERVAGPLGVGAGKELDVRIAECPQGEICVGGADASRGTGLRGLADRIAALDGRLTIESPEGAGTIVRADIPCA